MTAFFAQKSGFFAENPFFEMGPCNNQNDLIIIGPFDLTQVGEEQSLSIITRNQDSTVLSLIPIKFQSPESSPFADKLLDNLVRETIVNEDIY